MVSDTVAIEELVLRVPGIRRDDAPRLVEDVMRRVQSSLRGSNRAGNLHLEELRVEVPAGASRDELVMRIADQLVEALR